MRKWTWIVLSLVSVALLAASVLKLIPMDWTEVLAFITGAVCVLMVVEQNIWNFPIGIANNIFFIIVFLSARLYGDMTLQFVYIALGVIGWYQWLHGGEKHARLQVNHTSMREVEILVVIGIPATIGMREYFMRINDSAPFLDAFTTVLSLVAQYLLNYKRIENWYVWIFADVLYVWLYTQKHLYLSAVLYAIFIGMCIAGLRSWYQALHRHDQEVVT